MLPPNSGLFALFIQRPSALITIAADPKHLGARVGREFGIG
jgi:hypothetical protein